MKQLECDLVINNVQIFDGNTIITGHMILVSGDVISGIVPEGTPVSDSAKIVDGEGNLATAGFIDLQLNGCGGVLFNTDVSEKTLDIMNQTNLKYGVTQFLPTLITSDAETFTSAIDLVNSLENKDALGVLGLHLEGPFISKAKKGAHQEKYIRALDNDTADYLVENKGSVKVVTIAPENVEQEAMTRLSQGGITVSMGHTNATYDQLKEKAGIQMATHLYNAMSPYTGREPGAVGYVLDWQPNAGIIADGIHVDYASIRIAHNVMGENLFLVTDAVTPAGTDLTEFNMAGVQAFVTDGKCHYADGTIAGAAITMSASIANLVNHAQFSLKEALRMATVYPAKALKIDNEFGRLQPGYKANITLINEDVQVQKTVQMGQVVYQA